MSNCPEFLEALYACFKLGCAAVPINFRLHAKEFAFVIDHSQAAAVIVSAELSPSLLQVRRLIPAATHLIAPGSASADLLDYEALLADESDRWTDFDVQPDDSAWLFYTSGTTGAPKGAVLTHRNLLAMTMGFYADICPGCGPQDTILHAAPMSHASGLWALPNIAKAAKNVIVESRSFDADAVLALIEQHRVSNMFCVATMVKRLLASPRIHQCDHSSLRALCYGGGPMMTTDVIEAVDTFGPVLCNVYGQGESPMTISCLQQAEHQLGSNQRRPERLRSVGRARTDVEVKVFDDNDLEVPLGQIGEIVTRSDVVMKGYWQDSEATAETLRNGWLHTGDVGLMDEHGYVFLMDRSKDMIVSGGENIYPREVEEVLSRHPAVEEAVVIGVPDSQWGEAIKAVVVLRGERSIADDELIAFCREHLAGYKLPKSVDLVDELPKSGYGKVLKRELRATYWRGADRKI